jgi:adenine deaminase
VFVDLKIENGQVLNVFTQQFENKAVWIDAGKIVAVGALKADALQTYDAQGQYLVPGYIDAHVHVESALVAPSELGKVLLPHGVTSIFADPHEIANVIGTKGIEYMIQDGRQTPLDIFDMLPSSVPCTPFDHNGATLDAKALHPLYRYPEVKGLAEVMDYPAVAKGDADITAKIADALAHGFVADGHGAGLTAQQLAVYEKAGITTDHEALNVTEVQERLAHHFKVFLREGTVERDLKATIGAVTPENEASFAFCTDDKLITDLVAEGSIDYNIRLALAAGLKPEQVYTMASLNATRAHNIADLGALAAGYQADINILAAIDAPMPTRVLKKGQWLQLQPTKPLEFAENTVHHHFKANELQLALTTPQVHVIGVKPNHIDTLDLIRKIQPTANFQSDLTQDILKMVVVERHHDSGSFGLGLVHGFQIQNGAVATTIGHDAHNLTAIGSSDAAIMQAIEAITACGGGIAVANDHGVLATIPLAIAGLMSAKPYTEACGDLKHIYAAYQQISQLIDFDPFITLSFLTLPVIPTIKLTDQGLYDFNSQSFISVEVGQKVDAK